jgi:uncharacterized protein with predicted RNA binding PUA domain
MLKLDYKDKFVMSVNYIFGKDICSVLPFNEVKFSFSRRTGRLKQVFHKEVLFASLRSDGSIALTVYGATILVKHPLFLKNCIIVEDGPDIFVSSGKSLFAKHIISCGDNIHPGSDVTILNKHNHVIAVGKAILSAKMMRTLKRGVAVKIRESIKQKTDVEINV